MLIAMESTNVITSLDGVPCRLWEGATAGGVPCHVYVHRVQVREDADCSEFERELQEQPPAVRPTYPLLVDALRVALAHARRGRSPQPEVLDELADVLARAGG